MNQHDRVAIFASSPQPEFTSIVCESAINLDVSTGDRCPSHDCGRMPKPLNAKALATRLQALRPSKQVLLRRLKQGGIAVIALGGFYLIAPPLWNAVSPQEQVKPLRQRIEDLDKQIKKSPSATDLKEIATLEKGRIDSENTIRTSLFQAVGGLLVFVTLGISWLTLKANEAKQVAERFSKAVEQLGNDNIHVRLGGIYALEQIAKDAEEKYYWQVIETLTSYVRERSPYPAKAIKKRSASVQAAIDAIKIDTTQDEEETPPLPTDIQAVMTVLARRRHSYGHPLERHPIDLHGADLRRLQLRLKARLNHANFSETDLKEANLYKANLQEANFYKANLQEADLRRANLQEADLYKAKLQKAKLDGAKLQKARLEEASLQEAYLFLAELQKAKLDGAKLQKAKLNGANLQEADLRRAKLQEADLSQAKLQKADIRRANLQGADLFQANLQGVRFKNSAPSQNAQVETQKAIELTLEQLNRAAFYDRESLPDYLLTQPHQPQTETARSPQSEETFTAALNAIRTLTASYKSE